MPEAPNVAVDDTIWAKFFARKLQIFRVNSQDVYVFCKADS